MTSLPLLVDTVSSFGSQEAAFVLLLPLSAWLLPTGIAKVPLGQHGTGATGKTMILTTPANGHHHVATDVAPSF
jgi:hypothetical protein